MHRLFPWEQPKNEHDVWRGEERSVRGVRKKHSSKGVASNEAKQRQAVRRQAGALV